MSKVIVYAAGLCSASACAPEHMHSDAVAEAVNAQHPTGISSRWAISDDAAFKSGQPNPCACEQDPGRRHWLLNC